MTELKTKVKREFRSGLFDRRPLIVMVDPDGYIRLKEKRSRRIYSISLESLYILLVRQSKEKKETRYGNKRNR